MNDDILFGTYTSLLDDSQEVEVVSPIPPPPPQISRVIRGKSFAIGEDEALCKSWLAVSQDSAIGNNQTMALFWDRIRVYFISQPNVDPGRSSNSLSHRWAIIQKSINKFSGFYNQVQMRNPSGMGEYDKIAETKRMYQVIQRKHFTFDSCWDILRHSCKWDELSNSKRPNVQDSSASTTSSLPVYESPTLLDSDVDLEQHSLPEKSKRPVGNKAEKEARKKKGVRVDTLKELKATDEKFIEYLSGISSRQVEFEQMKALDRDKRNEREKKKEEQREEKLKLLTQRNEREQRHEDAIIMSKDMTNLTPVQKLYYEERQRIIMAKQIREGQQ